MSQLIRQRIKYLTEMGELTPQGEALTRKLALVLTAAIVVLQAIDLVIGLLMLTTR